MAGATDQEPGRDDRDPEQQRGDERGGEHVRGIDGILTRLEPGGAA